MNLDNFTSLIYLRMYKCANNNMNYFGNALKELQSTSNYIFKAGGSMHGIALGVQSEGKSPLLFGLVREPLEHYISGYNEAIARRQSTVKNIHSECFVPGFDELQNFSPEKFREYVRQSFANQVELGRKCWNLGVGFQHVFPMSNVLTFTNPDPKNIFFRDIKFAEKIPQHLRGHFNLTKAQLGLDFVDRNCGQHVTSNDPYGSYNASKTVSKDPDDPIVDAICLLVIYDFACFPQYYVPASRCKRAFDRHKDILDRIVRPHVRIGDSTL